ncbi:MAG TPA: type II toxin-antitoxin system antitoxin SocA domain-containing protein [Candidatus Limnocylindria bacterium]|nr:type II toxin-antitoxin system antitoxin SocA domain-containing protein [Candidatus Limnocylindria bacterium]
MSRSKTSAYDVANAFVKLSDPESGDVLTNLKLQKLVYYAQGFHLAMHDEPLFDDPIVAWEHGPVVVELYHKLKEYRASQVSIDEPITDALTANQINLLAEVNDVYGQFSAWKLRNMTHNEAPWQSTERDDVIEQDKLRSYFKTQLQ